MVKLRNMNIANATKDLGRERGLKRGIRKKLEKIFEAKNMRRHTIHQVRNSLKGISQENLKNMHIKVYGMSDLKEMTALSLSNSILFRSTRTSNLVKDAILKEVRGEGTRHIYPTIIQTKNFELSVKLCFN